VIGEHKHDRRLLRHPDAHTKVVPIRFEVGKQMHSEDKELER
jgi:hypothetical protein